MRNGSFWTRLAASSGIGFAGVAVAAYVIGALKDFPSAAEIATKATPNVWSTWVLLVAVAGVLLLWFTATSAARLQQIEGGSGRIAAEHRMAGAAIAALLFTEVAVQIAARSGSAGLDGLAKAIVNGPVLPFAAGVYALAAGVVGTRAGAAIPTFSGVIARVSVLLGLALIAGGGLWLYRDYAWLNDTVFFAFVGWVFVRSALGTFRWVDIDEDALPVSVVAPAARRVAPAAPTIAMRRDDLDDDEDDTFAVPRIARATRAKPKAAKRRPPKPKAKPKPKPPARKPVAAKPKPVTAKPAPAKRAPRKAAPRPAPAPEPIVEEEPTASLEPEPEESATETLGGLDDLDFGEDDEPEA